MSKTRSNNLDMVNKIFTFFAALLLVFVSICLYSPVSSSHADGEVNVVVDIHTMISLMVSTNAINFIAAPTSSGVFETKPVVATVFTNSASGYELYFSSADSSTAMTSQTTQQAINSDFLGSVTGETMAANKWGYSIDGSSYQAIPAISDHATIRNINHTPSTEEKVNTVNIGVKIDTNLPTGTYVKTVKFTAVPHASPTPNLNKLVDLTSMQDPNLAQYCADTYTPTKDATEIDWDGTFFGDLVPRASVQDSRDGKYYLISKLADGNCWMSQNLEFMLDSTEAITDEKTDLNTKTSWTPENSTLTEVPTRATWPDVNIYAAAAAYSYYPIASDRYYQGGNNKSSTPTASGVEYDWEKAGIYYNWYAATAGSGTLDIESGNAGDSICPKGWRLPLGDEREDDKSFSYLIYTIYSGIGNSITGVLRSPLNYVRAGWYGYEYGAMYEQGSSGSLWTSTASPAYPQNNYAYHLNTYISNVQTAHKGSGFSVRCVAR